ncbi:MAG: hypothetical protein M3N10_04405 [Actinomycetota bacterium]|nr:hypothetical protein [Actinomycetota bacterium]
MISELIRVIPVAILVGLLPGYFWARLLCATEDFASRLAYSAALSITLVSAVALAQVRLLGTGLSFTIAVSSPLIVFSIGLIAYLVLGSGKESRIPLLNRPVPPGVPALLLFLLAFVAALAEMVGLVPYWLAWPAAILLVLSGAATHLLSASREEPASREAVDEPLEDPAGAGVRYALLSGVLLLVLARGYLGPVLRDWPFLRADDQYQHTIMTRMMISEGSTGSFMLYPPGIHLFMAELTHLSGVGPLAIFAVLIPALLVLPTLAVYALGRRLWGWEYGLTAAAFYGLLTGGSYWYLEHGRYPNIIAAQFLMVLALAALFRLYDSPSWRSGLLLALLGSSVVLFHQVGSFYIALLLFIVTVLFLPYALLRERERGLALLLSFGLLGVLSALFAWNTYDLPKLAGKLLGADETGEGGEAVAMAFGTKPPDSLVAIVGLTSQPLLLLGLLGVALLAFDRRRTDTPCALILTVLLAWTFMMVAGSATSYSGFPDRFARDLGVPLALLGGMSFVTILRSVSAQRGALAVVAASLTLLATATVVDLRAMKSLVWASEPSEQLTMSPQVAAAGEWLEEHNTGGNIVVSPYTNRVPTRGVLALGGYTGMQSYDAPRIERARDIPPPGAEPLWDALWILENPEGEKTRQLIQEHDVRYIVLSKRNPGSIWPVFDEKEDLYRKVFENDAVAIFEPKNK